jgi:hypothetical protein
MLAFRYRRLGRVRARTSFVSIARAHHITADSASPRRPFPSSRRGFEPPRPVVRARARHPPARKNARHHRGRTPNGTLGVWLPSSLKQTHTEETQVLTVTIHTSPAKACLKSCLRSCLKSCLRSPRPSRQSKSARRARVNAIPSSATATSSVEESKKNRRRSDDGNERTTAKGNGRRTKRRHHLWTEERT